MFAERPQYILLPVRIGTIVLSFIAASLLSFLPWSNLMLVPDFVALTLAFWCIRQPRLVGLAVGWLMGLLMDTGNGVLLGQHALAYSLLAFAAISLSRRILWFSWLLQAMHVALILIGAKGVEILIRMASGGSLPGWTWLVGPLIGAMLWPVMSFLLLAPQRRAVEIDDTRPI